MKKLSLFILILGLVYSVSLSSVLNSPSKEDYKIIKKAIGKEKIKREEVKWFKILVVDTRTQKPKVRITIPISLMELIVNSCPEAKFRMEDNCKIELKKFFYELKKLGPLCLIEINEENETVKIWVE
ncbi:hypothetical protein NLC82_04135 [Candidatus Aminicenantes bacterium AC-335-A11]|jgi:hypothetical protein|nr:hypothetical protein [SCandidatus Aminicenantes bacterium Aminicenantia_JdfR_composite]MCP2598350.1 hypothetical protein [Candidatus Aminicenantes bacterium AC-335-L06]MCP2618590.1 hypothetical protein [Candidatus Aminicenantes bacterium AC-335-A11]